MRSDLAGVIFWQVSLFIFHSVLFTSKYLISQGTRSPKVSNLLSISFQTTSKFFLPDLHTTFFRLMFGHWVRQCGRWHKRNHLFLTPNTLAIAGRHSSSQNYTLLLFTTFYESVLNPLCPVLIRATCSRYVPPPLFFKIFN